MSDFMPVAISGIGAVTPVGLSAITSCAALRAGINRMGPVHSFTLDDERGEPQPLTGGRVPTEWFRGGPRLEEWPGHERFELPPPPPEHLLIPDGHERLVELALHAAVEAWGSVGAAGPPPANYGLFVGLDEQDDAKPIAEALMGVMSWRPALIDPVRVGRAAALTALHRAALAMAAGHVAGAIVGGVDSLIRTQCVEKLIAEERLKDDDHPHGIVPGEAAAFVVLEARPARRLATLMGAGYGEEPTVGTDRPNQGRGLSDALRGARASAPPLSQRPLVVCDLNGDRYRALEWSLAMIRVLGDLTWAEGEAGTDDVWHPADCIGDSGAASGAVDVVWAIEAMRKGYAGANTSLVWGASDGNVRASAILAAN